MPLDRTTEAITHFIGLFHLDVEAGRMRDWYDAFKIKSDDPEPEEHPEVKISLKAPYRLKKAEVDTKVKTPVEPPALYSDQPYSPLVLPFQNGITEVNGTQVNFGSVAFGGAGAVSSTSIVEINYEYIIQIIVPLPNSIMTATVQSLYMSDNDHLSFGHGIEFVDHSFYTTQLTELADALSIGLSELIEAGQIPSADVLEHVIETAQHIEYNSDDGKAYASVQVGADAQGIYVNGELAEEMPDPLESFPEGLKPEEEDDTAEEEPYDGPPGHEDHDNPYDIADGHHVSTGENLSANEAYLYSNWVDAGVFGVMGDLIQVDIISQINVLSEYDQGGMAGVSSSMVNAAQIIASSSEPIDEEAAEEAEEEEMVAEIEAASETDTTPTEETDDADPEAEDMDDVAAQEEEMEEAPGFFPSFWQVERVEGDVVAVNWVQQHIFATDHDTAEIEFSGHNTNIDMGENILSNFTTLVELGFHYDLIIVGGSMITINMIEQINVLLDMDTITGSTWAADAIEMAGNYLHNSASIEHTGIDEITEMSEEMLADAEALADGADDISSALVNTEPFEGLEFMSVLYIEGNLIEFNAIEQHNYVGDADQVHLALEEFVEKSALAEVSEVTVTMGENALVNDAKIQDVGLDSTIMAAGETYTEAMIHQAGLIDDTANPTGVAMSELSSEAVAAFLTSGMIDPEAPEAPETPEVPTMCDTGNLDVMQSMLA